MERGGEGERESVDCAVFEGKQAKDLPILDYET